MASLPFPFIPRHFTIIAALTIGIPGFFLALAPNDRRARTGFLARVLRFAIPAGLVAGIATMTAYLVARRHDELTLDQQRTVAVIMLFIVAMWVLAILARPLNAWRLGLVAAMGGAFVAVLVIPPLRDYFDLPDPDRRHDAGRHRHRRHRRRVSRAGLAPARLGPPPAELAARTCARSSVAADSRLVRSRRSGVGQAGLGGRCRGRRRRRRPRPPGRSSGPGAGGGRRRR